MGTSYKVHTYSLTLSLLYAFPYCLSYSRDIDLLNLCLLAAFSTYVSQSIGYIRVQATLRTMDRSFISPLVLTHLLTHLLTHSRAYLLTCLGCLWCVLLAHGILIWYNLSSRFPAGQLSRNHYISGFEWLFYLVLFFSSQEK